ncbi:MAG: hypothetical protein ABSB83_04870 [Methanomassiliicoccales archaeon]|jgi:hypothetical protein
MPTQESADSALWKLIRLSAIGVGTFILGEIARAAYESCDPAEKENWRKDRIMHHGEFGVILMNAGKESGNSDLVLAGAGLALSDIDDSSEWRIRPNPSK